jgi:hypothetical protein
MQIALTSNATIVDALGLTALPRNIALAHPNRYTIHVITNYPMLWANNPHIASSCSTTTKTVRTTQLREINMDYIQPTICIDHIQQHFITQSQQIFEDIECITLPYRYAKGDLYFSAREQEQKPIEGRYWALFTGNAATKTWSTARWQQVVDRLAQVGIKIVQCGCAAPKLDHVINMVGQTSLREVLQLILHAEGVLSSPSFAMHVAAALDKPCVVVAGGSESRWWNAYENLPGKKTFGEHAEPVKVPHRYLHTIDQLPCCTEKGCWKRKIQDPDDKSLCVRPVDDGGQRIPECMHMITVDQVVDAVYSYYDDGTLEH